MGGLGIGIYLVRQIAQLMDTEVEARSTVGEGSEFTLRFPIAEAQELPA
ncbi:MAG: ATP-binding protein [Actinomycetota bacterium]